MLNEDLKEEIWAIIHPDSEDIENLNSIPPHKRLNEHFGLDTSYFQPSWSIKGDRRYDVLIEAQEDPLNKVIESISVPTTLIDASLNLFAESMINYCFNDKKWGVYRYFPSILMTGPGHWDPDIRKTVTPTFLKLPINSVKR